MHSAGQCRVEPGYFVNARLGIVLAKLAHPGWEEEKILAIYSDATSVKKVARVTNLLSALGAGQPDFLTERTPSEKAPHAGIYKCIVCGHEVGIAEGHELPPQNHYQHPIGKPIRWRLLVATS